MEFIDDLLQRTFDFSTKAIIYNNMEIAMRAYGKLIQENISVFNFEKSVTARGHLRTLFIEKQFSDCAFNPNSRYSAYLKEVNRYHYKTLFIETDEISMNIARTHKSCMLPPRASYKQEYAKNNSELNSQYELDIDGMGDVVDNIVMPKKYAFLTYGGENDVIDHLEIVVPSHNYDGFIGYLDLLKEAVVLRNYVPEEIKEESIVSLKEEIAKEHKIG